MAISFKRNSKGDLIAVDDTGKEIGTVSGMGDLMKYEKKTTKQSFKDLSTIESEIDKRLK